MEIFVKTQHDYKKLNWFSSIPYKFKEDIKQRLRDEKLDFDAQHTYQVIVNLPKLQKRESCKTISISLFFIERMSRAQSTHSFNSVGLQTSTLNQNQAKPTTIAPQQRVSTADHYMQPLSQQNFNYGTLNQQQRPQTTQAIPLSSGQGVNALRKRMLSTHSVQNLLKTQEDKLIQKMQEQQFKQIYDEVVINQLKQEGIDDPTNIQYQTMAVKYLGISEGKLGVLSRKVPMSKSIKEEQPKIMQRAMSHQTLRFKKPEKKQVLVPKLQERKETMESEQPEEPLPVAKKPQEDNYIVVQTEGNAFNNGIHQDYESSTMSPITVPISPNKGTQSVPENMSPSILEEKTPALGPKLILPQPKIDSQQTTQRTVRIQSDKQIKSAYTTTNAKEIQQYINQKTFQKISQKQNEIKLMNKIHKVYEDFNKINQLIPKPMDFDNFIINKYSLPKGLKSYKRQTNQSESEQEFQDRYTRETLEKMNLMDRRRMLGNFSQNPGLQGSKIKAVVVQTTHRQGINTPFRPGDTQILPASGPQSFRQQSVTGSPIRASTANVLSRAKSSFIDTKQVSQGQDGRMKPTLQGRPQTQQQPMRQQFVSQRLLTNTQSLIESSRQVESHQTMLRSDLAEDRQAVPVLTNKQILLNLLRSRQQVPKEQDSEVIMDQIAMFAQDGDDFVFEQLSANKHQSQNHIEELYLKFLKFKQEKIAQQQNQ